jgi:hypothetical protein
MAWVAPPDSCGGSSSESIAPCTVARSRAAFSSSVSGIGPVRADFGAFGPGLPGVAGAGLCRAGLGGGAQGSVGAAGASPGVCSTISSSWPMRTARRPRTSTRLPDGTRTPSIWKPLTVPRSSTTAVRASKRITACHDDTNRWGRWSSLSGSRPTRTGLLVNSSGPRAVFVVVDDGDGQLAGHDGPPTGRGWWWRGRRSSSERATGRRRACARRGGRRVGHVLDRQDHLELDGGGDERGEHLLDLGVGGAAGGELAVGAARQRADVDGRGAGAVDDGGAEDGRVAEGRVGAAEARPLGLVDLHPLAGERVDDDRRLVEHAVEDDAQAGLEHLGRAHAGREDRREAEQLGGGEAGLAVGDAEEREDRLGPAVLAVVAEGVRVVDAGDRGVQQDEQALVEQVEGAADDRGVVVVAVGLLGHRQRAAGWSRRRGRRTRR